MTGMLHIRGEEAAYYRKKPKQDQSLWPPKFMKVSQLARLVSDSLDDALSLYYTLRLRMAQISRILKLLSSTLADSGGFDFAKIPYTSLLSQRWVLTLFFACQVWKTSRPR